MKVATVTAGLSLVVVLAAGGEAAAAAGSPSNPTDPAQAVAYVIPDWRRRASGEDLMRVYPQSAARRGLEGIAMVVCSVTKEGGMADCVVDQEAPTGEGFGEAALKLTPKFRMRPRTKDGVPVEGGVARIPIQFRLPR
jgi:protein TonB